MRTSPLSVDDSSHPRGLSTIFAIQCNYRSTGFLASQQFVQLSAITASLFFWPLNNFCNLVQSPLRRFFGLSTICAIECNHRLAGFLPLNNLCNLVQSPPRRFFCLSTIGAIECNYRLAVFLASQQFVQLSAITALLGWMKKKLHIIA